MIKAKYQNTVPTSCRAEIGDYMIRIIVCDDNLNFLNSLRSTLRSSLNRMNLDASIHIYTNASNIPEPILSSCDIAFLDIDLHGQRYNGIDIARTIRKLKNNTVIIFVTNYIEYAPEGYEVQAFRYLLKKDVPTKLDNYLSQAISKMQSIQETFHINISGEPYTLSLSDILYIEAQAHVSIIYIQQPGQQITKSIRVNSSLKYLEERLVSRGFLRIQKSYLVNMRRISRFQCTGAELDNGIDLPVSEKNYSQQKKLYLLWKGKQ